MILNVGPAGSGDFEASHGPGHLHMVQREIFGGPRCSEGTAQWYVEDRHMLIDVRADFQRTWPGWAGGQAVAGVPCARCRPSSRVYGWRQIGASR